jgi:primosomal protein N' (replication factor Y)
MYGFLEQEIAVREQFHYPPFTHLVKLAAKGQDAKAVQMTLQRLRNRLNRRLPGTFEVLPIVPCGHARVKGEFRFQFLIKADKLGQLLPLSKT